MATTYAVPDGRTQMAATLYTGTGAALSVSNAVNGTSFQPDWVWIKSRSNAYNNMVYDVIRGAGKVIFTNSTSAEGGNSGDLLGSFNSNGFSVNTTFGGGSDPSTDGSAATYVGWQWKANGTGVTNTNGSLTSTVSANTTAGFSVVTYTGSGANATVGHGLGVVPSMIIVKSRSSVQDWAVYHISTGNTGVLQLNTTSATIAASTVWNNTSPTSSVFTVATNGAVNGSAATYVAYCFAAVAGYSAFGSYTGNGSTDGPFVFLGFRPRFVMVKRVDSANSWCVFDTSRNTSNATTLEILANSSNAENSSNALDILSNGFKWRDLATSHNASGGTYIYMAFAENPLKFANAR